MNPSDIAMTELLGQFIYGGAIGLIVIGIYAMVARTNLIRIILGLALVEGGVNLFLVAVGFRPEAAAPILLHGAPAGPMVDPVPQALVLTAIVIGVGVLALAAALIVRVKQEYGTLDTAELARALAAEEPALGSESSLPQPVAPIKAKSEGAS